MADDLRVILYPDPRLKKKSVPVTVFDEQLKATAARMFELMRQHEGVGLAAPQVGLNVRLFVVNATGKPEDDRVYVNPMLSEADGDEESEEGCLSLPDVKVQIRRPTARVKMQAQDLDGKPFEEIGEGFVTRVWQHENDHLNGVMITDRMGPVAKLAYRKKLKEMEDEFRNGKA
jgi:peptide deformylase